MKAIRCANSPRTAQLFVQLSLRPRPCSSSSGVPARAHVFDILLPNPAAAAMRAYHFASSSPPTTSAASTTGAASSSFGASAAAGAASLRDTRSDKLKNSRQRGTAQLLRKRWFGTTPRRRGKTVAAHNPQSDENGEEMVLEITPRAAKRLTEIMTRDSNPHLALRIQVESGGCHGFQYLMSLVTLPSELPPSSSASPGPSEDSTAAEADSEPIIREDDTIFIYQSDSAGNADAEIGDGGGSGKPSSLETVPKIILDAPSLELLKGSKVDFTMELIGSQFKIVDNPLATSSCGCGTSFDIKF